MTKRHSELLRYTIRHSLGYRARFMLIRTDGATPRYSIRYRTTIFPNPITGNAAVSADWAESFVTRFAAVRVSLVPRDESGLDGTEYTLTFERGFNRVRLQWWVETPEPSAVIDALLTELEAMAGNPLEGVPTDRIFWEKA